MLQSTIRLFTSSGPKPCGFDLITLLLHFSLDIPSMCSALGHFWKSVIEDRLRKRRVKSVDELSEHLGPYFIRHNAESTPTECENHELSLEFWTVARDGDGIPNTTSSRGDASSRYFAAKHTPRWGRDRGVFWG
jgi:hypothetical protein